MSIMSKLPVTFSKKILLLCIFILLAGLSSGFFFTVMLPDTDRIFLSGFLQGAVSSGNLRIIQLIYFNLLLLALIFLSGLTVYGFPLAVLIFFCRSMSLGVCIPLMTGVPAAEFFTFLFSNLLLLLIFLAVTVFCVTYGLENLRIRT